MKTEIVQDLHEKKKKIEAEIKELKYAEHLSLNGKFTKMQLLSKTIFRSYMRVKRGSEPRWVRSMDVELYDERPELGASDSASIFTSSHPSHHQDEVEIEKAEFDEAFYKALKIIRENHEE